MEESPLLSWSEIQPSSLTRPCMSHSCPCISRLLQPTGFASLGQLPRTLSPPHILPVAKSYSSFWCQDTCSFFLEASRLYPTGLETSRPLRTHAPASWLVCLSELGLRSGAPAQILPGAPSRPLGQCYALPPTPALSSVDETPRIGTWPLALRAATKGLDEAAWKKLIPTGTRQPCRIPSSFLPGTPELCVPLGTVQRSLCAQ